MRYNCGALTRVYLKTVVSLSSRMPIYHEAAHQSITCTFQTSVRLVWVQLYSGDSSDFLVMRAETVGQRKHVAKAFALIDNPFRRPYTQSTVDEIIEPGYTIRGFV